MEVIILIAVAVAAAAAVALAKVFFPNLFKSAAPDPDQHVPHGNQFLVPEEQKIEPDTTQVVVFPERKAQPVTPFEDFNQRLFILKDQTPFTWPERLIPNDYATVIAGDIEWARHEIHLKLRPKYPTILDTFGWWAEASKMLELNPYTQDPVVAAYLAIPLARRPVVISRPYNAERNDTGQLEFFRYQFTKFVFDRKFLSGHPVEMLREAMTALTGPPGGWWAFSAARARKKVLDADMEQASRNEALHALEQGLRAAVHKNRFAALWELPADTEGATESKA